MGLKVISLSLFLACAVSTISGQDKRQEKNRYVVVPSEIVLPVIASQPDSPLQFEDVRIVARIGGGSAADFKLRNRGTKAIRSLSYAVWFSNGTGWMDSWPRKITSEIVMSGQLVPFSEDETDEIVPLTDELREKLKLRGEMKAVVVFMVLRAEFTDGTKYSDEAKSKALEDYFERLCARADP